jgi:cold shock CspA family protein
MHQGLVKSYSSVSGYGFILSSDHGEFFFHVTAISMYWRACGW